MSLQDDFVTTVKVVFRKFEGEIVAFFPEESATLDPKFCCCYSHTGQHSTAEYYHVLTSSIAATDAEAVDLKSELESIGYNLELFRGSPASAYQKRQKQIQDIYNQSAN